MLISEKITLVVTAWMLVLLFITGDADLELFFILMFIGVILIQEFSDEFTNVHFKTRMYVFISLFFIIFVVLIGRRILSFLSI